MTDQATPEPSADGAQIFRSEQLAEAIEALIAADELPPVDTTETYRFTPNSG